MPRLTPPNATRGVLRFAGASPDPRRDALQARPMKSKRRCRLHGGLSTGPHTPEGLERCRKAKLETRPLLPRSDRSAAPGELGDTEKLPHKHPGGDWHSPRPNPAVSEEVSINRAT